jgi:hypothetical protein
MANKRKQKIWVLIHCEYSKINKEVFIDEAVFYVFSSLRMVERYIRSGTVEPFSWWKAQQFIVNEVSETETVRYYNYKGKSVSAPPFSQARRRMKED